MASGDDRAIDLAGGRVEEENSLATKIREMDRINNIPSSAFSQSDHPIFPKQSLKQERSTVQVS
uniref:Uncharacterized protein n=1 Tax=Oryza glumipatula TaxID=40148 RepID=A0A0D9YTN1_9ORYZ